MRSLPDEIPMRGDEGEACLAREAGDHRRLPIAHLEKHAATRLESPRRLWQEPAKYRQPVFAGVQR